MHDVPARNAALDNTIPRRYWNSFVFVTPQAGPDKRLLVAIDISKLGQRGHDPRETVDDPYGASDLANTS